VNLSEYSNLKGLQLGTLYLLGFPAKANAKQNSTTKLQNLQIWAKYN